MKHRTLVLSAAMLAVTLLTALASESAMAQRHGRGHGHGRHTSVGISFGLGLPLYSSSFYGGSGYGYGGFGYGGYGGYYGPNYYGPGYYYPPAVVYSSPVVLAPAPAPVYIEQPRAQDEPAAANGNSRPLSPDYWYYCQNPQGYFPYVKDCAVQWQAVAPVARQ
jgi:hypothetical protein